MKTKIELDTWMCAYPMHVPCALGWDMHPSTAYGTMLCCMLVGGAVLQLSCILRGELEPTMAHNESLNTDKAILTDSLRVTNPYSAYGPPRCSPCNKNDPLQEAQIQVSDMQRKNKEGEVALDASQRKIGELELALQHAQQEHEHEKQRIYDEKEKQITMCKDAQAIEKQGILREWTEDSEHTASTHEKKTAIIVTEWQMKTEGLKNELERLQRELARLETTKQGIIEQNRKETSQLKASQKEELRCMSVQHRKEIEALELESSKQKHRVIQEWEPRVIELQVDLASWVPPCCLQLYAPL